MDPIRSDPQRRLEPPSAPGPALGAWLAFQIVVAIALLVVAAAATPLSPRIALDGPGLRPELAIGAGLVFWLGFGLVGGLRARHRPGGAVLTFSMPFIVAGSILGGPFAGALMGWVSELEIREIRTQPWYGTLANHAVSAISAVAAALVFEPARHAVSELLAGQEALAFFVGAMASGLAFNVINVLLVIPTLALRNGLSISEAARTQDAAFRATALGEGILAWNLAAGYELLGWWAPVACVVLVLIVWQAHDRSEALRHDDLTGLLNDAGFRPRVEAAVRSAAAGSRSAALLVMDLDDFFQVNDTYGMEAGDEVLITTARRLLASVRATDSVSRRNRAGDEFGVLMDGVPDVETATRMAARIRERIREPIRLRSAEGVARVGLSIGVAMIERGASRSADEVIKLAEEREATAKELRIGIATETDRRADATDRRLERKREIRSVGRPS